MAKQKSTDNNMLVQGTILAFAGIFVRLIGIAYRIPMTNIIGDTGNGYYSSAFQIYNIILLLSSYSMPQAISRLISQRIAKRQYKNARMLFFCAVFISILFGLFFSLLLYLEAGRYTPASVEKPVCFEQMKEIASKLSRDHKYVRVDLYNIDGKPIFGELTFTPGLDHHTIEFQKELGDLVKI